MNLILQLGVHKLKKAKGARIFVTDENGRIVKEITPERVKTLNKTGPNPEGKYFEGWDKGKGKKPPTCDDLELLNLF